MWDRVPNISAFLPRKTNKNRQYNAFVTKCLRVIQTTFPGTSKFAQGLVLEFITSLTLEEVAFGISNGLPLSVRCHWKLRLLGFLLSVAM